MNKNKIVSIKLVWALVVGAALLLGADAWAAEKQPVNVIFETDMGNDVDDALALDMLYKYVDAGRVNLLAIMLNKESDASARFVDIMGTYYGHPNVPIGVVRHGADCHADAVQYCENVVGKKKADGTPYYATTLADVKNLPDAHTLYRKILAGQKDGSVVIVSIGFSTNLSRLVDSKPDRYSRLNGVQLMKRKVKMVSVMAGSSAAVPVPEYNVIKDTVAANNFFAKCPVPIVCSPFEVGIKIMYPYEQGIKDMYAEDHPVRVGYEVYHPKHEDTPTWDLTSVLYAVETDSAYFNRRMPGRATVDGKGCTHFKEVARGANFSFLATPTNAQAKRVERRFLEIIGTPPANKRK